MKPKRFLSTTESPITYIHYKIQKGCKGIINAQMKMLDNQ